MYIVGYHVILLISDIKGELHKGMTEGGLGEEQGHVGHGEWDSWTGPC